MTPVVLDSDVASLIIKERLPASLAARLIGRQDDPMTSLHNHAASLRNHLRQRSLPEPRDETAVSAVSRLKLSVPAQSATLSGWQQIYERAHTGRHERASVAQVMPAQSVAAG